VCCGGSIHSFLVRAYIIPMPTLSQLSRTTRKRIENHYRTPSLDHCPQKRASCLRVLVMSPKKPNSAQRRIAKLRLSNGARVTAHIPGIGHNFQKHGVALVRGARVRDLPGVRYRLIRGKYDVTSIVHRRQGRSKYGTKKL